MIDKRGFTLLIIVACCFTTGVAVFAQQPVVLDHEYEYKAAYLYHFAQLCTWPGEMDQIVIGVLGPNRFGRQLKRIEKQSEKSRIPIKTELFPSIVDYRPCQILFVSRGGDEAAAQLRLNQALEKTAGKATLIFTENRNFEDRAAVRFYIANNRLKLRLNLDVVKTAGVAIPKKLTGLPSVETVPAKDGDR